MSQLALFDQSPPQQMWTIHDVWTPAWNRAIDLAIITSCKGKWLKLREMADIASVFCLKPTDTPFSMQVAYLENIGKLKVRAASKTDTAEWTAT